MTLLRKFHSLISISFFFTLLCSPLVFFDGVLSFLEKVLITLALLAIALSFVLRDYSHKSSYDLKQTLLPVKPWFPWFLFLAIFMFVHGTSGLSEYLRIYLIMILGHITLSHYKCDEKKIVVFFALTTLAFSIVVCNTILLNGLSNVILGANRNTSIPLLTSLSIVVLGYLCIHYKSLSGCYRALFMSAVAANLMVVTLSEVRIAVLGYFSLIPALWLIDTRIFKHLLPKLAVLLFMLVALFLFSDRLQQGFRDLALYLNGISDTSWGIRLELWKLSLNAFLAHPLIGWGLNPFDTLINANFEFAPKHFDAPHFHNDFFNLLVTGGITLVFGWILTTTFLLSYFHRIHNHLTVIYIFFFLFIGLADCYFFNNFAALFIFVCNLILFRCMVTNSVH